MSVQGVAVQEADPGHLTEIARQIHGVVLRLPKGSGLVGRSLRQLHFRDRFGVLVVGIRRRGDLLRQELARRVLRETDECWFSDRRADRGTGEQKGLEVVGEVPVREILEERMFVLDVPKGSRSPTPPCATAASASWRASPSSASCAMARHDWRCPATR